MYPEFFQLGDTTLYSYGVLIMIGTVAGYFYMASAAKRELHVDQSKIQNLVILLIGGAFIGGKLFFYFEDPGFYFHPPSNMFVNFRTGFVFYGSLLFAVPLAIWYFRKEKWPLWSMLDHIAITTLIVHFFGRVGCFLAGCCYGKETTMVWGVTFSHELSKARPLHTSLHPSQLYEAFTLLVLFVGLLLFKKYKRFEGQLFIIYLVSYSVARGFLELFRGDLRRGFVIDNVLSHSQFISLIIISIALLLYRKRRSGAKN